MIDIRSETMSVCIICGRPLETLFCTYNICRNCCSLGKCPLEEVCAYKKRLPYKNAQLIINSIKNEINSNTKHFKQSTGETLTNIKDILEALISNDLIVEFHCTKCGNKIEELLPIENRLCNICRGKIEV